MKKIVALVLALALVLTAAVALADRMPEFPNPQSWHATYRNWTPNFDGTHSCSGKTVACEYEEVTYGNTTIKACPVCGDFNGEQVAACTSSALKICNMYGSQSPKANEWTPAEGNIYCENGQYIVRILKMPEDSDVAYAVTICHEIGGLCYDAEATHSYVLPLDGTGLSVKKAYFGTARDIKCETKVTNDGFYFKPYARENAFGLFLLVK